MLPFYLALLETEEEKSKFEVLYLQYRDLMYHIAYDVLRDEGEAEDALHRAFLAVIKYFDKVGAVDSAKTKNWLCLIAKNTAINVYRQRQIRFQRYAELDELSDTQGTDTIGAIEDAESLKGLLNLLPEKYRDILQLVIVYQHSYKQIADELQITEAAARKRFERGKELLRNLLRKRDSELHVV